MNCSVSLLRVFVDTMGCGAGKAKNAALNVGLDVGGNVAGVGGQLIRGDIEGAKDAIACTTAHTDYYRGDPNTDSADWMGALPDDKKILDMFIPGTHDTCASEIGKIAECQYWSSHQQLHAGIRVMDVRPAHNDDELQVFHGIVDCNWKWSEEVDIVEAFLREHPTEAVFMRVRREADKGSHSKSFHEAILAELKDPGMWNTNFNGNWMEAKLGDFRGKITPLMFGSKLECPGQCIDVQDEYDCADEDKKFAFVKEHAERPRDGMTMFVSFVSCVGQEGKTDFKSPDMLAYELNHKVYDNFDTFQAGCYLFDFPGNGLVKKIIERNN